ncbi:MAG: patatin-like phospholipase family protein [Saprospiraceae bacterium]|nr:patatin-like phospholipase family protein [Saprospiraceae bacterium]
MQVGLALSGGGARGIYHIGVLKALEEKKLVPDILSGSSVGALIGILYASGLSAETIFKIAAEARWFKFFKPQLPSGGLIGMEYIREILQQHLLKENFEDMNFPCYVTATNISKGKLEVFSSGNLIDPILASCSVPMLFKPVQMGADLYLDGGILMNLPASIIRQQCDLLIGSSLTPVVSVPSVELNSGFKIVSRVLELNINNNTLEHKQLCNILIESNEISAISKYVLGDYQKLYDMGYDAAHEALKNYKFSN